MPALTRDPQKAFENRIRLVTAAGVDLPADIVALQQRLKDCYTRTGTPMRDRLTAALIADDPAADYPLLWAAAMAEHTHTSGDRSELLGAVRATINREIRARYSVHAADHYRLIAAGFDAAAAALTEAVAAVEPELPADIVIGYPPAKQKAWRDAAAQAAELTRLAPALHAAATLAGICDDDPDNALPLCANVDGLHRRRVWEAWNLEKTLAVEQRRAATNARFTSATIPANSRTGRWGALIALGARIRAHNPDDQFTPYRKAKPMLERVTNHPDGPRRTMVDPEDPDYTEPQPTQHVPPRRVRVVT